MALWRTKNTAIEQRAKLEQDQQEDGKSYVSTDDAESIMNIDDVALSKAYSSELSVDVRFSFTVLA